MPAFRLFPVSAARLLSAFGSCFQSRRRGYYRHSGLVLYVVQAGGHKGGVAFTGIWVVFVVKAGWLLPPFGSCRVCSQGGVTITGIGVVFAVKATRLLPPFGSCLVCSEGVVAITCIWGTLLARPVIGQLGVPKGRILGILVRLGYVCNYLRLSKSTSGPPTRPQMQSRSPCCC